MKTRLGYKRKMIRCDVCHEPRTKCTCGKWKTLDQVKLVCNDLSEQQDKATPRPWTISAKSGFEIIGCGATHVADCHTPYVTPLSPTSYEEAIGNAALIVRAVNQHAALMAVAEAAKLNDSCWLAGKWEDNDRLAPIEARIELHNALAALNP